MQSQQKRVKWSRGETAEALEERTDTGITQASVALMENCIPDIYGNISRRPALKPIPLSDYFVKPSSAPYMLFKPAQTFTDEVLQDESVQFIPFYITEDDIIIIGVNTDSFIRIKDGQIVAQYNYSVGANKIKNGYFDTYTGKYKFSKVSYAQQNNYMIIASDFNVYKVQFTFGAGDSFTPVVERFVYSGGWYAPNGTQTKQVNTSTLPGLAISGNFYNYVFTDSAGNTSMFMNTDTGLDGQANLELISEEIPVGSIIELPNIGCHFRVEGYYNEADNLYFSAITFSALQVHADMNVAPGVSGNVCVAVNSGPFLEYWADNVLQNRIIVPGNTSIYVKSTVSGTGYSSNIAVKHTLEYRFGNWQDASQTDASVRMYGALLTPVVDENATDTVVSVEYGYESLSPDYENIAFDDFLEPHPTKLCFHNQRLWAGGWATSVTESYALVIGSQIARYNDFKNDYNQENEPVTLDVLTSYKEKIVHLIDYNGLKIFTDSFEYAYEGGGVVKQSANGALESCSPIIFESLCLYVDKTGNQIRAMQYEFQSNIFNSSCINQMAAHDLIWYPVSMSSYEDKIYSTGKHLFVLNQQQNNNAFMAVCNFVPSNQANIWSRWKFPQVTMNIGYDKTSSLIHSIIDTKKQPIFMIKSLYIDEAYPSLFSSIAYFPAIIDFTGDLDIESGLNANNRYAIYSLTDSGVTWIATLPNMKVAVYSNGEYKFTTTTTANGQITDDLTGLTNITVGLMINSKIVSHPIDVGGKTKSVMKRIGKTQMSVHDTSAGAITINGKTGYMNPRGDHICFYGVTGMKDEVKYTLTNKNGAMFHLESLLMNIEYGTLDS